MLNRTSGRSHCREYERHPWPASRHWVVVRSAYLGSISVCIVDTGVVALVQPLRGNGGRGEVRESVITSLQARPRPRPRRPHPSRRTWVTSS